MKIKIKDTFTKANAVNYILMFLCVAAAVAFALMGPMVSQWFAAGFALLAGFAFCCVIGLRACLNLIEQVLEQTEQVDVVATLDQQHDDAELREQLAQLDAKYKETLTALQVAESEYTKLAKAHNGMARQLSELKEKYNSLSQRYDELAQVNNVGVASEKPTTPPKPKKNPVTATSQVTPAAGKKTRKTAGQIKAELKEVQEAAKPAKKKYSKGDIARIKEELKSVGINPTEQDS